MNLKYSKPNSHKYYIENNMYGTVLKDIDSVVTTDKAYHILIISNTQNSLKNKIYVESNLTFTT